MKRIIGLMLSKFLNEVFPELDDAQTWEQCWVAKAIRTPHPGLAILSEALEVVDAYGELESLQTKVGREHPLDREHNPQHDARVRDCLVEACAFAWVAGRTSGTPRFSHCEGTPDIMLDTGNWVEVKAIHNSEEDDQRIQRMLSGEGGSGLVTKPDHGLYVKFEHSLMDAIKKFERQEQQKSSNPNVVFFNLTTLDVPQLSIVEDVLADLKTWAEGKEKAIREGEPPLDVRLVMCYSYDWKAPFTGPLGA